MNYQQSSAFKVLSQFCITGFLITLALPYQVNRIFLVAVYFIFILTHLTDLRGWLSGLKINWKLLPLLLFLVYTLSCLFFTSNMDVGFKYLEKNLPLVLLPLLWPASASQQADSLTRKRIEKLFVLAVAFTGVACLLFSTYTSIQVIEGKWVFDPRILKDERIDFYQSITWGGNYFFSDGLSFIHPSYFSLYITLAFFLVLQRGRQIHKSLWLRAGLSTFFTLLVYLLASKAGFIALFAGIIYFSAMRFKSLTFGRRAVLWVLIFIGIAVLFLVPNPRFQDLLLKLQTQGLELNPQGTYSYESRLLTWASAIALIKAHPLTGVGVGDAEEHLMQYYREKGYTAPLERQYNVHNQYLETWLNAGVAAIAILLLMLLHGFIYFIKRSEIICSLFFMLMAIHFLFESMLDRYAGIVFFIFFYSLYFSDEQRKRLKQDADTSEK